MRRHLIKIANQIVSWGMRTGTTEGRRAKNASLASLPALTRSALEARGLEVTGKDLSGEEKFKVAEVALPPALSALTNQALEARGLGVWPPIQIKEHLLILVIILLPF